MRSNILSIILLTILLFIQVSTRSQNWLIAKHAGGNNSDASYAIALDQEKNIYMGGKYFGQAYFDTDTIVSNGLSDFFLAKYNTQGNLTWVIHGGGPAMSYNESTDIISDIKISTDDDIFVTGTFNGTVSFGGNTVSTHGTADCFVARYDTAGNCIWVRTIGGIGREFGKHILLDNDNNIYVTARSTYSSIIYAGNIQLNIGEHGFVLAKYDIDGNFKWIKTIEGDGTLIDGKIHFKHNYIYIGGLFAGNMAFDTVSFNTNKSYLPVILKLDTAGKCILGKSFDCIEFGEILSLDVSDSGYIYCVGESVGTIFAGNDSIPNGGGFAIKTAPSGNPCWLKVMGDGASTVEITSNNQIFAGGWVHGTKWISDCLLTSVSELSDMFVAKLNTNGDCEGALSVYNGAISGSCLDNQDQYYITGSCGMSTFGNITPGNYGDADAFWAKLDYVSGIGENKGPEDNGLYIYANPNTGVFTIEVPKAVMNERNLTLKIFDNSNRLVKQQELDMTEETLHVEVPQSKPGMYFLQLISKKRTYSGKMVVQ